MASTTNEGPPASVAIGLFMSYGLAGMLLFCGILGLITWDGVGVAPEWGRRFSGSSCSAPRISRAWQRVGRAFIGLLNGIITVAGVVYMFKGPTSAIFPSIVVVMISAGTFALLYLPEESKRFYA